MVLALLSLTYQVWNIHEMQSINAELSGINFRAASILLRLDSDAEAIFEFSEKYFTASGDPIYASSLDQVVKEFDAEIINLQETIGPQASFPDIDRLVQAWSDYKAALEVQRTNMPPEPLSELPEDFARKIDSLASRTSFAYDAVDKSIRNQVASAAQIGAQAEKLSWLAGAVSVVLGFSLMFFIVRAISEPLRQLTSGTRIIAKGKFWHRLPTDRHDEFAELARDFNAMSERLGELDQMKKDFVSHVSHELKAPLASMRQTCHLLLEQIPGPLNEQQRRLLRLSNNSGERLAAMVGNLLDASRLEAGTMEYEVGRVDLVALASTVADEFEVQAKEKNVPIRIESPKQAVAVECDRDRIIQVIGNLFDNALKFSPRDRQIVTRIEHRDMGGSAIAVFSVIDSGPGVPDGHKDRVFKKFHQVKQGKKITGQGVGLGLAICKSIVEAHHGRIWVEDNPSGGSVFSFELRAAAKAEVANAKQLSTSA